MLLSYNLTYPGILSIGEGAIERLRDKSPQKVELLSEFLDLARFPGPDHESRTARYLAEKYAGRTPDVVITAGREASAFILKYREEIAPNAPLVVCCMSAEALAALGASNKITGVISGREIARTLDLAERLQPGARNLVVIAGANDFDRQWVQIARQQIATRERRYETKYLVGLPYDTLMEEVSRLPRDTIAIMLTYFADDRGGKYVSAAVAQGVATAASAPVYSPYSTIFGHGVVGGYSDLAEFDGGSDRRLGLGNSGRQGPQHACPATEHFRCIQGRRATAPALAILRCQSSSRYAGFIPGSYALE